MLTAVLHTPHAAGIASWFLPLTTIFSTYGMTSFRRYTSTWSPGPISSFFTFARCGSDARLTSTLGRIGIASAVAGATPAWVEPPYRDTSTPRQDGRAYLNACEGPNRGLWWG